MMAALSCTREPAVPDELETVLNGPIPVTLVVGEPSTRTELHEENSEIHPWWSKGDGISVITFPGGTDEFGAFNFDSNLGAAGPIAQFSGLPNEPGRYFAIYPQQKKVYDSYGNEYDNPYVESYYFQNGEVGFSFTLPSVQHPSLTSFDPDADLLISEPFDINVDDYDENENKVIVNGVSFTRMNAIVKIVLKPETERLKKQQTVRKVTIGTQDFSSGGGGGEIVSVVPSTRADVFENDEDYASHGLAGNIYVELYSDRTNLNYYGRDDVTAEYTDETYQIGDKGAATYLITYPCILKNGERYDEETGEYVYDDGLHIRVETDDFVIERNVVLPPNGIALQPSRVTTLNIKLYDDGVEGTTIQTIGVTLNKESVSMKPGKSMQLEAQFSGIFPSSDELEGLVWTSSDPNVATVEPVCYFYGGELRSGNVEYTPYATVTAQAEGTATITATYQGKYVATCEVTVEIVPEQPSQKVDLGLPSGTLWAQWDLGTQSWDQEGDLYAWGETQYKDVFSWDTYKWADGEDVLTKYTTSALFTPNHQIDHKFLLDLEDDAAYVNWGPDWYTPTQKQWEELRDNCTWSFVYDEDDNVIGCCVTGPNGNSIVFPSRENTYYFNSFSYMCSLLPMPDRGDYRRALSSYNLNFNANEAWSSEQGSHISTSYYYYVPERGEDGSHVRPVSGGTNCRREYTEDDLGAITVQSSGGTVKARFPVYESEREQSYKNDPQYEYYAATAVILYSTDPNIEPCNYFWGHRAYNDSGSYENGKYVRFSLDDYKENQVCSFVPEGMSGTVYYRAYYYSTVKKRTSDSNAIIVNEKWGVTRAVTIP
jgi:uncharacterized protein YjdB